ncbi:DUF1320 domain-containing protein [Glaesserella parasuis]|uniref:DUF1320 domain-containing protein n=3 Tax=Glaesserella parasuis TaxID=738 RepID=A0A859IE19_GLAPU|nr:DUF1320 domain-containing protein [Glaesserella parasuis]AGO17002.1 putative bacteriophage protein [Glaesserella parasuis ZJ0906]AIK90262.1 hypothetical protein JT17_05760 [Glaesserella parasuis]EQA09053.1 hypothetical protein HPS8415995_0892 [Glaesserella parasuis 84-15995]KDD82434.1 hypothetical protein HPS42_00080 [Glaesserella parasuis ST4-2]MCT8555427.1 DUF1320 domain-containing protein [Glaesserella parasuis]
MYITADELIGSFSKQILVQLSNDDHRATDVNMAVVEQAIQTACERIDASLRSRYALPLTQVPTMINSHALYLARHWLYTRRAEMKMPETVKDTYAQVIKELDAIAKGTLHLGLANAEDVSETGDLLPDVGEYAVRAKQQIDTGGY